MVHHMVLAWKIRKLLSLFCLALLKDRERCEALLVKIREMYAKKHEEPPAMIASGTSTSKDKVLYGI